MTQEQIDNLKTALTATSAACNDTLCMISDYMKCDNEISKKYLSAAIKKHASSIMTISGLKPELFS